MPDIKINMKRKVFAKNQKHNFKRFKKTPKHIKEKIKEKDPFLFTDSEDDGANDLGMGLELSDLPLLDDDSELKSKQLIALTQHSVRPFFTDEASYDEAKLDEALVELRHSSFRPNQKETIKRILFGRSTLFISPTGSGKSLCYQLPALIYWRYRKYMTIVVSPLISLMEDQINTLPKSLKAVSIHSNHSQVQKRRSIAQLVNGEASIVFISPEAIVGGLLGIDDLKNLPPVGFVCIDEAHCLSEWSHNFRPAYLQFFEVLNEKMNIKTFLGLTATATKPTAFAIARSLTINPEYDVIGATTIPSNLILSVSHEINKREALINLLKSHTFRIMPSIIIYCNRREETEHVATSIRTAMQAYSSTMVSPERLKVNSSPSDEDSARGSSDSDSPESAKEQIKLSWNAEAYHAGLGSEARKQIQRRFIKGETRVVVATVAFGMGINKSNIRAVIHYDMPGSLESYVQEIGRAGRDGQLAQCHMFLRDDKTDLYYQQRNIYSSVPERKNITKLLQYLFRPCVHRKPMDQEELQKLEKLNQADPHFISSEKKTRFISTEVSQDSDDDEDYVFDDEDQSSSTRRRSPTKFVRESIVKKHRRCDGHELAFSVDEAKIGTNLWPESIITIMCQIQRAYPQFLMKQFPATSSTCRLYCYKGTDQMEALAERCPAVKYALFFYKHEQLKQHGSKGETPQKFEFDIMKVASYLGKNSADVKQMLRRTEWDIVEETGRFRRSQVRVKFEGNSFHILAAGDLTDEELKEVEDFLFDSARQYEKRERERIAQVYHTFKRHCISVDQMANRAARMDVSDRLKAALNTYFDPALRATQVQCQAESTVGAPAKETNELDDEFGRISDACEEAIKSSAKSFVSAHEKGQHTPITIAKIFQGISTPNAPSEHWGPQRRWWRIHADVDFKLLVGIIQSEWLNMM